MKVITFFPLYSSIHRYKDVFFAGLYISRVNKIDDYMIAGIDPILTDISLPHNGFLPRSFLFVKLLPLLEKGDRVILFHLTYISLLQGVLGRFFSVILNRKNVFYLKGDFSSKGMNSSMLTRLQFWIAGKIFHNIICELPAHKIYMSEMIQVSKVETLPNFPLDWKLFSNVCSTENRVREILVVARHGVEQKNSYETLGVLSQVVSILPGWKVVFLGPITEDFKSTLFASDLYNCNIFYEPPITCRKEYSQRLSKSMVGVFLSLWEGGAPLSASELALSGNLVVGVERLIFPLDYEKLNFPFRCVSESATVNEIVDILRYVDSNQDLVIQSSCQYKEYIAGFT